MELTEKTRSQKRVFTGRLIHVRHDEVILPDGTETIREVVEHPGGVAIAALTDQARSPSRQPRTGRGSACDREARTAGRNRLSG